MHVPEFSMNTPRDDPYKTYKFRVMWEGRYVHRSPGQTEFGPITLERGVTHDEDFEAWANKVWNRSNAVGNEISLQDFRKDINIEHYNEAGQKVEAYKIFRCWVSAYTALPDLDAGNAVAIQSITLQNEGWERDTRVTEPT